MMKTKFTSPLKEDIRKQFLESAEAKRKASETMIHDIENTVDVITRCLQDGGKVLVCGNGGSAADAQHFAAEFVNRFRFDRASLPVMAVTTDSSILTSIGNDSSFDHVFEKPVRAFGKSGDILLVITTSDTDESKHGHSANIARALLAARGLGLRTIGLISQKSKRILEFLDISLIAPHSDTARIQEVHCTVLHIISELVERKLFQKP